MKKISVSLYFLCSISFLFSQSKVKFTQDGNGFYESKNGEIIINELPSLTKKTIVTKAQLTPKNESNSLAINNFILSNDEEKILIYTNSKKVWRENTRGDYWVLNLKTNSLQKLGKSMPASSLMFAKFNSTATKVAYVSNHNIYVEDIATSKIEALSRNGTTKLINGTFDWVYEEEFGCKDGFRWSDDGKNIAFWQIDASKTKSFLMLNTTDSIYSFNIPVEYPKVGELPSSYKIGVVTIATKQTKWMQIPGNTFNSYLPKMEWSNNNEIIMEQMSRKQNQSIIYTCNINTGIAKKIYEETATTWIDPKFMWDNGNAAGWNWINKGKEFLWVSEKDGWRKVYSISTDGKNEKKLMIDNHDLINLNGVDEKNGWIYYLASPNNATQKYLYRCKLDGSGIFEKISSNDENGTHSYSISTNFLYAKHGFSSSSSYPTSSWINLETKQNLIEANLKSKTPFVGEKVEFIKINIEPNTTLDGWMIKPNNFDSTKKYPVVFYVYSEPAAQTVLDTYGGAGNFLYAGNMAADGYIQISIDGRGTPSPKGAAWRKSIYKKIGILNIEDQVAATKEILKWKSVDTSRIAVWGWSGGGSTTLNLMFQYPNIYKTGISIAPVANQLTYDNIYQERYMGLPQENKEDFIKGSPITYAKNLLGNLLIIHGTGDDNVHYQNTEMVINELVKYNKQFSLMSYPNRTHSISEGDGTSLHLSNLYTKFLKENCPGGGR